MHRTHPTSATARAAAVIPRLGDGRVLVGVRTRHARSWPGTIAFPGGACEDSDGALPLVTTVGAGGGDRARACALRELGEEVGLWLFCGPDGARDAGACASAVDAILGGAPLGRALDDHRLVLDDRDLVPLLLWKTWDGRFSVQQFLLPLTGDGAAGPERSRVLIDELTDIRLALPSELCAGWREGTVFLIPPIRRVIVEMAEHERAGDDDGDALARIVSALSTDATAAEKARHDLVEGIAILSARTPTLPPATHTNAVLLGVKDALLVDPATPYADERERFDRQLEASLAGEKLRAIVCTHHHQDHVGDVARLREKLSVPVWAHEETAARVDFPVDRMLHDGEVLTCGGAPERRFRCVFTPGHARGHLCFFEESTRLLVAGDMVAAVGSILIDPPEGHMGTYLASLDRLIALAPRAVIPSHGPLIAAGQARLEEQRDHRKLRQMAVLATLPEVSHTSGGIGIAQVVQAVYGADTPSFMLAFAERSVLAALELCGERGEAFQKDGKWWRSAPA